MRKLGWLCGALAVAVFVACTGPTINVNDVSKGGAEKSDKDKIQGTWVLEGFEVAGKKMTGDDLKNSIGEKKIVFSGDKTHTKGEQDKDEATFTLDSNANPHSIDITDTKGEKKGKTTKGIYAFDGADKLKIAMSMDDKGDRPNSFTTNKTSKAAVMYLKREK
jgi:uncharacterized protein (TIGR03067 family)